MPLSHRHKQLISSADGMAYLARVLEGTSTKPPRYRPKLLIISLVSMP